MSGRHAAVAPLQQFTDLLPDRVSAYPAPGGGLYVSLPDRDGVVWVDWSLGFFELTSEASSAVCSGPEAAVRAALMVLRGAR